jgi:hypothetical protein
MGWLRDFTQNHLAPVDRAIDDDAPRQMRDELVDFFFHLAEESNGQVQPRALYEATGLMLGGGITANPYGGYPARVSRDIGNAFWARVYDWISRMQQLFERAGMGAQFREGVNTVLAAHGLVWELDADGQWQRILPEPLQDQMQAAIAILGRPGFQPARELFEASAAAFNDRPRRDRDACSNAFDALESVAKIVYGIPNGTFGNVLDEVRRRGDLNEHVLRLLRDIEIIRHNEFGHGNAHPFRLNASEVDFVYTTAAAGILLFSR